MTSHCNKNLDAARDAFNSVCSNAGVSNAPYPTTGGPASGTAAQTGSNPTSTKDSMASSLMGAVGVVAIGFCGALMAF